MFMEPGDLLVQPNWTWHGTTNPGNEPMFWIDIQDRNLVNYLGAFRRDLWPDDGVEPTVHPENYYAKATGLIQPTRPVPADVLPPIHYRWRDMVNALDEITESAVLSPYDGKMFEYRHPSTGGHTLPTLSAQLQLLAPQNRNETTPPHRHDYVSGRPGRRHDLGERNRHRMARARLLHVAALAMARASECIEQRARYSIHGER